MSRSETIGVQQCRTGKYRSESVEKDVNRSEIFEGILSRSEMIELQQCRKGQYRSESVEEYVNRSEILEGTHESK